MKHLNEFDTLAEAQAYEHKGERMISPDMMLAYITKMYLVDALLENPLTNEAKAVKHSMQFGSEFNLIENHRNSIVEMLNQLIVDNVVTEEFKQALIIYANPVTKPYELTTQEEFDLNQTQVYVLSDSTADKTYTLSIANSAPKATQVKIMQQVGNDENDLTEWHQVGQFSNVHYKQHKYKARIPATDLAIRKLKLVSDYTLGLSVE